METQTPVVSQKKKPVLPILIGILLVAVIAIVCVIVSKSRAGNGRLNEQLRLGAQYLSEMNYEQAVAAFEAALAIEPKNVESHVGLVQAYAGLEDAESILSVCQRASENLSGADLSRITDAATESLQAMLSQYESAGDTEKAARIREILAQLGISAEAPAENVQAEEESGPDPALLIAAEGDLQDLLEQVVTLCRAESYREAAELLASKNEFLNVLPNAGTDRFLSKNMAEYPAGIYHFDWRNYVYIGGYDGESRIGNGVMVTDMNYGDGGYAYIFGTWANDAPNGEQDVYTFYNQIPEEYGHLRRQMGTTKDGLWEGDLIWDFGNRGEDQSILHLEHGLPIVREITEDDGWGNIYVVGEYTSGGTICFDEAAAKQTWGIPGYSTNW